MNKKTHLYIPDTQVRPGVCLNHLNALGHYIVHNKPDVIIQAGDFTDMHSLSSYDTGKKSGEGARYEEDIRSAKKAMAVLMAPIVAYNKKRKKQKKGQYLPRLHLTLGNHENRINRHVNSYPVLDGRLSTLDLDYGKFGWKVHDFLEVIELDGISYSHYFPRNAAGRIVQTRHGAPCARLQVQREGRSCTSGHLQGLDIHLQQRADKIHTGLIAGSFYMHEEDYLGPQGTAYWRGIIYKHEVDDGSYDPMMVSMKYLLDNWYDGGEYNA